METDSLTYTLVVTILGMGIVFLFLFLLSLGMEVVRQLTEKQVKDGFLDNQEELEIDSHDDSWITAAVIAYLETENNLRQVRAEPWNPLWRKV